MERHGFPPGPETAGREKKLIDEPTSVRLNQLLKLLSGAETALADQLALRKEFITLAKPLIERTVEVFLRRHEEKFARRGIVVQPEDGA